MKHVDIEAAVNDAVKIQEKPAIKVMSRAEKLNYWAGLVRNHRLSPTLGIYHRLEYYREDDLIATPVATDHMTAFGVAVSDPGMREQGLQNPTTVRGIMNFFELSQGELHEFSCDCGGAINNEQMASRIEKLAKSNGATMISHMADSFSRIIG